VELCLNVSSTARPGALVPLTSIIDRVDALAERLPPDGHACGSTAMSVDARMPARLFVLTDTPSVDRRRPATIVGLPGYCRSMVNCLPPGDRYRRRRSGLVREDMTRPVPQHGVCRCSRLTSCGTARSRRRPVWWLQTSGRRHFFALQPDRRRRYRHRPTHYHGSAVPGPSPRWWPGRRRSTHVVSSTTNRPCWPCRRHDIACSRMAWLRRRRSASASTRCMIDVTWGQARGRAVG